MTSSVIDDYITGGYIFKKLSFSTHKKNIKMLAYYLAKIHRQF